MSSSAMYWSGCTSAMPWSDTTMTLVCARRPVDSSVSRMRPMAASTSRTVACVCGALGPWSWPLPSTCSKYSAARRGRVAAASVNQPATSSARAAGLTCGEYSTWRVGRSPPMGAMLPGQAQTAVRRPFFSAVFQIGSPCHQRASAPACRSATRKPPASSSRMLLWTMP